MIPYHYVDEKTGEKICPSCGHRTPKPSMQEAQRLVKARTFFTLEDALTKGHAAAAAEHWEANHSGETRPEGGWPYGSKQARGAST